MTLIETARGSDMRLRARVVGHALRKAFETADVPEEWREVLERSEQQGGERVLGKSRT